MKLKIFAVLALVTISVFTGQKSNAQIPDWLWAKSAGGSGNDVCKAIAVDDSGNVYSIGSYEGTVDFDPGPNTFNLTAQGILDIYILKLDPSGNFLWAKSFGGTGTETGYGIKTDHAGSVYATGRFADTVDFDPGVNIYNLITHGDKDVFILKLNTNGDLLWAQSVGGTGDDEGFGLTLDNATDVLVTGYFADSVDFNPGSGIYTLVSNGNFDAFILKLENNGNFLWAKSFGGSLADDGTSVATDSLNNVYTTGYFIGTVDFDPGITTDSITTNGYMDIYISKLDATGKYVWAKNMGGTQTDDGLNIYADPAGNVYSTGTFRGIADFDPGTGVYNLTSAGGSDIYVSKLFDNSKFAWAGRMGEGVGLIPDDYGYAITADNKGNIYATGSFKFTVDFDPGTGVSNLMSGGDNDAFILKLDTGGNFVWAKKIGAQYSEQATSIAFDNNNHLYVGGHFMSYKVSFGNDTLTNTVFTGATADIFIAKLDSGLNTAGVQNHNAANQFSVYPNPAKDLLVIGFEQLKNKEVSITITDATGRIIYHNTAASTAQVVLNTAGFAEGLYLVKVQADDFISTQKVIITK